MKTIIAVLVLILAASAARAEEFFVPSYLTVTAGYIPPSLPTIGSQLIGMAPGPEYDVTYSLKDGQVTAKMNTEYIEVVTRNATYRVYPCGKLEKLTWKELNRNEDKPAATSGLGWVTTPGVNRNTMPLEAPFY